MSQEPASDVEIIWDTWGVPHIYAETDEALAYGLGWAQACNHGDLILRLFGQARGRAAEYWGADYLDQDRQLRRLQIPARSQAWLAAQDAPMRRWLNSFAAGINEYASQYPDRIDAAARVVLPIDPADILAHVHRVIHLEFLGSFKGFQAQADSWTQAGSNAWAVAPSHSASGNSLLLINPHLSWSTDFHTWFEVHLVGPEMNLTGATLVGMPVPAIGFNDDLGWAHTVNPIDAVDLYELELSADGYLFDGQVRPFETTREMIKIRGEDGAFSTEELIVRRSVHGPVLSEGDGKALAVRMPSLDRPHLLRQWLDMGRATNLDQFVAALRQHQMPMFNVIYADVDGHILYRYEGQMPKRPHGDGEYWSGVVPGNTSDTLWTEVHDFDELPMVVDPPTGWVQNANDPPWLCTYPAQLEPGDFPSYFPQPSLALRPQRSIRMLLEHAPMSFEELLTCRHSTYVESADRLLDDLVEAARCHGDDLARKAAAVLKQWDRTTEASSVGGVLFARWFEGERERLGDDLYAQAWDPHHPLTTPQGLADPKGAAGLLGKVAADIGEQFGTLAVPWGKATRLSLESIDLPASGGEGVLGIFLVMMGTKESDGRTRIDFGDSFTAAVEFAQPVRARVLLSYGNASQSGSPHVGDQLALLSRGEMRVAWRGRAEIEANLGPLGTQRLQSKCGPKAGQT